MVQFKPRASSAGAAQIADPAAVFAALRRTAGSSRHLSAKLAASLHNF
jgi:hypothetical protein